LSADDPLWTLPNVFISPHISGTRYSYQYLLRTNELFCENLRRLISGEPLYNVVLIERGY
jgi:phosphoglycerate dehydrogenase-like enzyme